MPIEINAQFNRFVQFAQGQKDDLAIARKGDVIAGEGALAGRAITAAVGDKVGAVRRSAPDRDQNNATRALFRESVVDIFGGEDMVPANVREAMEIGEDDDNRGKPLTARRILTVQKAIATFMAAQAEDYAVEFVNAILQRPAFFSPRAAVIKLTAKQLNEAIRLLAKSAKNLGEKNLRFLAGYVAVASARGYPLHAAAKEGLKAVAAARDVAPGDKASEEIERRLLAIALQELEEELADMTAGLFDRDGVSEGFKADAPHGAYVIGGKEFDKDPKAVDEFKAKVKPEHRKALSCFLGRKGDSAAVLMSKRLPPYDALMKLPGAERFLSFDLSADSPFASWPVVPGEPKHSLSLSGDGKRATVAVETPAILTFGFKDAGEDAAYPVGGISWKQEFVFDLSGPKAVLTNTHISQNLNV